MNRNHHIKLVIASFIILLIACDRNVEQQVGERTVESQTILDSAKSLDTKALENNSEEIRRWYPNGGLRLKVSPNVHGSLDHWTEYYENGKIKEEGLMVKGFHFQVGTWTYYNSQGEVDSMINFDETYPVSYFDALKIAEEHGYVGDDLEVSLVQDQNRIEWKVCRWVVNPSESGNIGIGEGVLINVESGKVRKPDNDWIAIY